jgi:roadblock/LC7 domain-containing protein
MLDLESLTGVKGVIAALRFYDDGTLAEAAGHLDQVDAQLAAEMCQANGRIMQHTGDMLMTLSSTPGWPSRGWMMTGDELSILAVAEVACLVRNGEASFNDVFRILTEVS